MTQERNRLEIEMLHLISAFYHKIWLVILVGVLSAGLVLGVSKYLVPTKYESMATLLVLTKETTLASLADLQMGSQLTKDYALLIESRPVLQKVIDNLGMNVDHEELDESVTVTYLDDSRVLTITTIQNSPEYAKAVVDEMAKVASVYIGEQMEVTPPKIIEDGEIPRKPSSPDLLTNGIVGFIAGVLLVCVIVCINEILNDTIQTEEDIEKYIGGAVLAVVPNVGTAKKNKNSNKKARKKKKWH